MVSEYQDRTIIRSVWGTLYGRKFGAQVSVLAILTCLASAETYAQDQSIADDRTAPVSSTTELGAGAGTLTLTADGTVTVPNGTALTIDGPHNFTMEATSTITSEDISAGRGLFLNSADQRLTSNIELAGDIVVADPGDNTLDLDLATSVVGLELSDGLGLDGDINLTADGSITVNGGDSRAILISGPMNGNLTSSGSLSALGNRSVVIDLEGPVTGNILIDGTISAGSADAVGIHIGDTVDGSYIQRGTISVGIGEVGANSAVAAKAGLLVEADITGGILIDGAGNDNALDLDGDGTNDITRDATINSAGGAPGVFIRNTDAAAPLVIGEVDGLGFGYIQRGNIVASGETAGLSATGLRIEGLDGAATNIVGGLYFDNGNTTARSIDAAATGVDIGNYTNVPTVENTGIIDVDTFTSSSVDTAGTTDPADDITTIGPGAEATGILIREQALTTSINNSGSILATARGIGQSAYGIQDLSGQLTSVVNTGTIGVLAEDTDTASGISIDVSNNTSGFTLENSGQITGDVLLGNGNDALTLTSGTLDGDIFFRGGADTLTLSGDAAFIGSINFDGTLALNVDGADLELSDTDLLSVTSATFSNASNLIFNVDLQGDKAGLIQIDGALVASADVNLVPVFSSFTDETRSFDLISAGSIDFADSAATLALSDTPFLFNLSLDVINGADTSSVTLNVRPKTAAELGVSVRKTALYDNMINTGFAMDNQLESSLAGLRSKEEVEAALAALMPDTTNASFNSALISQRQFSDQLGNRLSDFISEDKFIGGAWAREVTNIGDHTATDSLLASSILSVGMTLGYDRPISKNFAVGVNAGFTLNGFSGTDETLNAELSSFAPFLSVYAMARTGGLYVGLQTTGQYVSLVRERSVSFGVLNRLVNSRTNGWNLAATAEAGYELKLGGLHFKPYGRLAAQSYSENGFTETGGVSVNQTVGKRSFTRTLATVGASLGYDFKWKRPRETKIVRPEVFYNYSKTISGADPSALDSIFVAGDTSYALEIDQMSENIEEFGGAVNLFGDGSTARVRYGYEKLDDVVAHAVSVNFALSF